MSTTIQTPSLPECFAIVLRTSKQREWIVEESVDNSVSVAIQTEPLNQITHILDRAQRGELLPSPTFVVVRRQRSDPPVKAHVPADQYSPFETGDLVSRITRKSDTRAFTQKLVATRSLC